MPYWRKAIDGWIPQHGWGDPPNLGPDDFVPEQPDPDDGFTLDDYIKEEAAIGFLLDNVVLARVKQPKILRHIDVVRVPADALEYYFLESGQDKQVSNLTIEVKRREQLRQLLTTLNVRGQIT